MITQQPANTLVISEHHLDLKNLVLVKIVRVY